MTICDLGCVCMRSYGEIGENTEGTLQKRYQVNQVVTGFNMVSLGRNQPIIVSELQKLVNFGIQAGVNLCLSCMTSILQQDTKEHLHEKIQKIERKKKKIEKSSTLKVEVPYSLVALAVWGGTFVMFDMNSSR